MKSKLENILFGYLVLFAIIGAIVMAVVDFIKQNIAISIFVGIVFVIIVYYVYKATQEKIKLEKKAEYERQLLETQIKSNQRSFDVIEESIQFIENSKNMSTVISRVVTILQIQNIINCPDNIAIKLVGMTYAEYNDQIVQPVIEKALAKYRTEIMQKSKNTAKKRKNLQTKKNVYLNTIKRVEKDFCSYPELSDLQQDLINFLNTKIKELSELKT